MKVYWEDLSLLTYLTLLSYHLLRWKVASNDDACQRVDLLLGLFDVLLGLNDRRVDGKIMGLEVEPLVDHC